MSDKTWWQNCVGTILVLAGIYFVGSAILQEYRKSEHAHAIITITEREANPLAPFVAGERYGGRVLDVPGRYMVCAKFWVIDQNNALDNVDYTVRLRKNTLYGNVYAKKCITAYEGPQELCANIDTTEYNVLVVFTHQALRSWTRESWQLYDVELHVGARS